jgi:hypothetical protein
LFGDLFRRIFKRSEGNLVELISLFLGLLTVNLITSGIHLGRDNWYLIIPLLILVLIVMTIYQVVISVLVGRRNRKVNPGYFLIVFLVIAFINTFVIH